MIMYVIFRFVELLTRNDDSLTYDQAIKITSIIGEKEMIKILNDNKNESK